MAGDPLAGHAIVIEVPVAWGEMDAFGHVNNIYYFRYFESARMAYLDAIGFRGAGATGGIGPILASTQCRVRRALAWPDRIRIGARTTDVGADRFTMEYRIVSNALDDVAAEGSGVIVAYDYANGQRANLPDPVRDRIRAVEHEGGGGREDT
jgi:acyl-CoA thioester hydrolase